MRRAPTGETLSAWADYARQSAGRIRNLEKQLLEARRELSAETKQLAQARRRLRLLEKLRERQQARWQREFDRETAAFADEAFLARLEPRAR